MPSTCQCHKDRRMLNFVFEENSRTDCSCSASSVFRCQVIKSMEFIQGSGGAGSIKQINFAEVSNLKTLKYRIDELNEETYTYNYTVIEGDTLTDTLEKITHEIKLEAAPNGGTFSKVTSTYYTKGDFLLKEEDIKAGKEKVLGVYKAVEAYLIQNPNAYA